MSALKRFAFKLAPIAPFLQNRIFECVFCDNEGRFHLEIPVVDAD